MSDLIDRQKAIDALIDALAWTWSGTWSEKAAIDAIKKLPPVDAVPVIRCKECVHYKGHWYCETWNNSPGFPAVKEDGFCNMAERRTDADE